MSLSTLTLVKGDEGVEAVQDSTNQGLLRGNREQLGLLHELIDADAPPVSDSVGDHRERLYETPGHKAMLPKAITVQIWLSSSEDGICGGSDSLDWGMRESSLEGPEVHDVVARVHMFVP